MSKPHSSTALRPNPIKDAEKLHTIADFLDGEADELMFEDHERHAEKCASLMHCAKLCRERADREAEDV